MNLPRSFVALTVLMVVSASCRAQEAAEAPLDVLVDVAYLSSDLLQGREAGTAGERRAGRYIASRFSEIGLRPGGEGGNWFQPFEFSFSTNPHAAPGEGEPRQGRNVIGVLDHGAEHSVIIGAHYDHLGYGAFGSRQPGDSLIHNGADDNASGVAALLEIARQLRDAGAMQNNFVFVAFSGEELGLYGSKHFVKAPPVSLENVNYMINLDMVGRLGPDRSLAVNGTGTSPAWEEALAAASSQNIVINKHASGLGPSDHASFYLEDIPVLHLFTGQHAEYHRPDDDSHLIDYEGIVAVASFAAAVVKALDDDGRIAFSKTQDEDRSRRTAFKVSMGIMPDYVSTSEGVRIDAVLDDRPAARAGLQKGDVVIKLGDVDVTDIGAYMEALATFEEGDVTTVVVRRGDDEIESEIRF